MCTLRKDKGVVDVNEHDAITQMSWAGTDSKCSFSEQGHLTYRPCLGFT